MADALLFPLNGALVITGNQPTVDSDAPVVWPTSLPQYFQESGFSQSRDDGVVAFPTDIGPGKRRPRFTKDRQISKGALFLTETQKDTLDVFYRNTLIGGTQRFVWVDPYLRTDRVYEFQKPPFFATLGFDTYIAQIELLEFV